MAQIEAKSQQEIVTTAQRESALKAALERGLPPDLLIKLGNETGPVQEDGERKFVKWATVGTAALVGGGLVANAVVPGVDVGEGVRQVADLIFTPGNAPVAEATLKTVVRQLFQWGIYFGESSVLIGFLLNGIKSRITRSDQMRSLAELQGNLKRTIEDGEAPIPMPDNYVAIDLGTNGDAMGRSLGEKLGWGSSALPLIEGDKNVSGYELWGKLPNPSSGVEKGKFFEALDRINFDKAKALVLCPVREDQAFLPDPANRKHFDLKFDEIIDRIALADEYCAERKIDPKQIVIICDGNISRTVAPYVEQGKGEVQKQTLKQAVEVINEQRKATGKTKEVIIADPTDIVLYHLRSAELNPNNLPFEFFEDIEAEETYGARFVGRCREMGIAVKTDGNPSTKSLRITYGVNDLGTRQTTAMLSPENTCAIIIDQTRAIGNPYNSVIVSDLVRDYLQEKLH